MALVAKKGSFAANTSTGDQAVTGVGFTPKSLIMWVNNVVTAETAIPNAYASYGLATSASQRGCAAWGSDDNAANMIAVKGIHMDRIVQLFASAAPTVDAVADFVSFDADGFTINWSDAPAAAVIVHWLVLGGTDIQASWVGSFGLTTSGATQAVTAPGFQPTFLLCVTNRRTAVGESASAALGIGAASSAADQASAFCASIDAAATSQTGVYQRTDSVIAVCDDAATPVEVHRHSLSSFDPAGFTLNHDVQAPTADLVLCLAIRGGTWKVGSDTQPLSAGAQAKTGVGFTPKGVLFYAAGGNATVGSVLNITAVYTLGASDGTTEGHTELIDQDAQATSNANSDSSTSKVIRYRNPSTAALSSEADTQSLDADGYTLNWTTADAVARAFMFAAFGDGVVAVQTPVTSRATVMTSSGTSW